MMQFGQITTTKLFLQGRYNKYDTTMKQGNSIYSDKVQQWRKARNREKKAEKVSGNIRKKNSDKRKTKLIEKERELTWLLG